MATATRRNNRPSRPAADDDARPTIGLPAFSPPIGQDPETPQEDPTDEVQTTGPTVPLDGAGGSWTGFGGGVPTGPSRTRTGTSSDEGLSTGGSTSKAETARNAGVLLTGVLLLTAGLVAAGLARTGRALRRPTRDEARDVARPLARILVRHVPAELITADLADLGEAAAGVEAYVSAGPVAPRVVAVQHIGMVAPDEAGPVGGPVDEADEATQTTPSQAFHNALNLDLYPTALDTGAGPAPKVSFLE